MSAPNDIDNPWMSLADILSNDVPVELIATAIETFGVQTFDRFGRRIDATDDGPDVRTSKASALNILAAYFRYLNGPSDDLTLNPDCWYDPESPLNEFGWPTDKTPDFGKVVFARTPGSQLPPDHRPAKPMGATERNTLLVIIAAICDFSAIMPQERGAAAKIAKMTDEIGASVTDDTIRKFLAMIPEALQSRMK